MAKEKIPDTKKPIYKKWWFWLIVVLVVGSIGAAGSEEQPTSSPVAADNTALENTNKEAEEQTKVEKDEQKPTTDNVTHRNNMYGISNKPIDDIKISVGKVRNDKTGNWRIATIAENINIEEYAKSYYEKYFKNDNELHGIVNFNYNTTTQISVIGDRLDIRIYEYVDKEEHDANLLYTGTPLGEFWVYLDNGDIEKVS